MERAKGYKSAAAHLVVRTVGNDEARELEGWATTPTPDLVGDVLVPAGAKFSLPLPLLFSHAHDKPVGRVISATVEKAGIRFRAAISKITEPGTLKDRCDEAWQSVREKLINSVSVGFLPLKQQPLTGGGMLFEEWNWFELSICTVPMNPEALITSRRSLELMLENAERKSHRVVRLSSESYRQAGIQLANRPRHVVVKLDKPFRRTDR
jgi:HK97 family phage prohead protease